MARWGGEPGSQEGQFYYPRGLAIGPDDVVYVADSGNNRVQKFDLEGNVQKAWGKFGFAWRGADMGRFDVPWGITTDQDGNVYVSDTSNARIQKFQADGQPLLKWGRDGSFDGAFFFPVAWRWISLAIFTWPTRATIVSRSSIHAEVS
ncbi:MAG: hypothetical protein HC801_13725 [Nitrospira sp.]|nr:hypothetical protein [Nitrospira sp.]